MVNKQSSGDNTMASKPAKQENHKRQTHIVVQSMKGNAMQMQCDARQRHACRREEWRSKRNADATQDRVMHAKTVQKPNHEEKTASNVSISEIHTRHIKEIGPKWLGREHQGST